MFGATHNPSSFVSGAASMRIQHSIFLLILIGLTGNTLTSAAQVSVSGRWQCTATGLESEAVSFLLDLTQAGNHLSGVLIVGSDEIPIREGKVQGNRIELITPADDKQFTSVATVGEDELTGTWKDDTGRAGSWQGKRQPAGAR
jgi:hypothetical protein